MNENLEYMEMFARFPFALHRFLQHRLTLDDAKAIVRERLDHREDNFLRIAELSIYGYPRSPYLPLLKMAGCELGDLRALVRQKGLESALRQLREAGVYITFEEFKGRKPIERNGQTIAVTARDFDNRHARREFIAQSSGSTGAAITVGVDFDDILVRTVHEMISLDAQGLLDVPAVRYSGILPAGALRNIIKCAPFGHLPVHWFSPVGLRDSKYWVKYGLATYYILAWLRLFGVGAPWPEYVDPDRADIVAGSVAEIVRAHGRCVVNSTVSRAMRVCQAAQRAGVDLRGAVFVTSSEPVTSAKARQILDSGAGLVATYGMVEANRIGTGCARSEDVGDVHFFKDAYALFTHPYQVPRFGLTVPAFNLTSLLPTASKVLLNVQMDDYGIVEDRHCGCKLESYGYTTHIREIRSYSKLTGEGVTLIGNEIVRVLEEVLPARFGGTPLDYQLLEQEDEEGFTRVYVVISPRLQISDEGEVVNVMLQALSDSSSMADAARTIWQQSGTLQVMRREPIVTSRGKQPPLRTLSRRQDDSP